MLLTASSRNWYSTPCSSPLPEPSSTTSMKIPQATAKPVSTVRSLLRRTVSKISCQASRRIIREPEPWRSTASERARTKRRPRRGTRRLRLDLGDDLVRIEPRLRAIVGDPSVDQVDQPVRHVGDVALVGDDHHRHAVFLHVLQHAHDVARGGRVERAGRLVGEQELRLRDQRAGDRHALLLAARQLRRQVLSAIREPDPIEVLERDRVALFARNALVVERQRHVLGRVLERDEVKRLEHEADELAAIGRRPGFGKAAHVDAVQPVFALVEPVEQTEQVHQGRLARPGGSHDGDQLARTDVEVDPLEDVEPVLADRVALVEVAKSDHRGVYASASVPSVP